MREINEQTDKVSMNNDGNVYIKNECMNCLTCFLVSGNIRVENKKINEILTDSQ